MIIKVCGLGPLTSLAELGGLPIAWGGLIFVSASPRYCGEEPFALPEGLLRVGVFRDSDLEQVLAKAARWSLDGVQLHGGESPAFAKAVRAAGYLVVKAIAVDTADDLALADAYADSVDYFLFDTPGGGTGRHFDWDLLDHYTGETPFLLAGGIGPGDEARVRALRHPRFVGIDLNSRFESAPGTKNITQLREFLSHAL